MLRFIIQRRIYDAHSYAEETCWETIDIDVPDLQQALFGGGKGPSGSDVRKLTGVELLPDARSGAGSEEAQPDRSEES